MAKNESAEGRRIVIAIDGPAGSGKSTLAALLAKKYGYINIETGAMYRALALKAMLENVPLNSDEALATLARKSRIELLARPEGNRVLLDGEDVTERIRREDITDAASKVSIHPTVREWMVERQRELGANGGVVMEGRDIGTKVFPDAEVKFFLDAAPEVRGSRRFLQQPAASVPPASVLVELRARDERDRTRAEAPLREAEDAVVLDTSEMGIDEAIAAAIAAVEQASDGR